MRRSRPPWVCRAPKVQLIGLAGLVGLGVFLFGGALDFAWALYRGSTIIAMVGTDALVAASCSLVLFKLMLARRCSHRNRLLQLDTVAEMNHHVRNALANLQFTAYSSQDERVLSEIQAVSAHIQWALREILPRGTLDENE